MNPPTSTPSSALNPLSYERQAAEPLSDVFRDGKHLVVHRGANISRYCLCCGRPATGKPILKHLFTPNNSTDSSFSHGTYDSDPISIILLIFQLLFFLFYLITLAAEWIGSRQRTVTFGLCEIHHRQRQNLKVLIWCSIFAGIGLMIMGIMLATHLPKSANWPGTVGCVGTFIGGAMLWVAAVIFGSRVPSLSLQKEQAPLLWVKGAREPFLNSQLPFAGAKTSKQK